MEKANCKNGEKLVTIIEEFSLVHALDGKDFTQVESSFKSLYDNFELAGKQRSAPPCVPGDRYAIVMGEFYDTYKEKMKGLKLLVENVTKYFEEMKKKLGYKKDVKMADIIATFAKFFKQLEELREENRKKKEMEMEMERKKRANAILQQSLRDENRPRKQAVSEERDLVGLFEKERKKKLQAIPKKGGEEEKSVKPSSPKPTPKQVQKPVNQMMGGRTRTTLIDNEIGAEFSPTLRLGPQGMSQIKALQSSVPGSPERSRKGPRVSITPGHVPTKPHSPRLSTNNRPSIPYDPVTFHNSFNSFDQSSSDDEFMREAELARKNKAK